MGSEPHFRGNGRSKPLVAGTVRALLGGVAFFLWSGSGFAGVVVPTGGQFAAGAGTIKATSNGLAITQSSTRGIINWQNFSIGAGQTVQFFNAGGATLNRVTGNTQSVLAGALFATGSVYLINPYGVVVTPTGQVLTNGSFVASTRDLSDDAFLQGGALTFQGGSPGTVVNEGSITSRYGDVVLIGQSVENDGKISAANGTAGLAAGDDVLLQPASGDQRIYIAAGSGNVTNTGTIAAAQAELDAASGNVYALAGNTGGLISATGTATINGHVWLTSGNDVTVSGTVAATNAEGSGGTIDVSGGSSSGTLSVTGTIDASATSAAGAGGEIRATAGTVSLGSSALVEADGGGAGGCDPHRRRPPWRSGSVARSLVDAGDRRAAGGRRSGGADLGRRRQLRRQRQRRRGRGVVGPRDRFRRRDHRHRRRRGGNGGSVEVSGEQNLIFAGTVDTLASLGQTGTLLLDPNVNLTISTSADSASIGCSAGTCDSTGSSSPANLQVSVLETALASSNVLVTTSDSNASAAGNITVGTTATNGAISWSGNNTLTLSAANNITFDGTGDTITVTGAGSTGGIVLTSSGGTVTVGAALTTVAGNISLTGTAISVGAAVSSGGTLSMTASTGTITQSAALSASGTASFTTSTTNKAITLTNVSNDLSGAVSFSTPGSSGNASLTNDIATTLGASTIGGSLTVTDEAGNLTQSGVLTVAGTSSFTTSASNATITLGSANMLTGAVSLDTTGSERRCKSHQQQGDDARRRRPSATT